MGVKPTGFTPLFNNLILKNMKKFIIIFLVLVVSFLGIERTGKAEEYTEWWEDDSGVAESSEEVADNLGRIYMTGEFLNGDLLKISILSEGFEVPVLGVAFHLDYEEEKLTFLKYEPGRFLENGGDPFYMVSNSDSGKIIFGETLRREDSFPVGGGLMTDFYFQILEEGEFSFIFENGVVSTLDVVRQDLDKVEWQDLSIVREDESQIILDSRNGEFLSSVSTKNAGSFRIEHAVIAFLLAVIVGFCVIVMAKKYRRKSQMSYVNFK